MFLENKFQERLIALRSAKGLKVKEVAESIGVTGAAWTMFEHGANLPKIATLYRIADFFDVSIDYLVGRSEDPTRR